MDPKSRSQSVKASQHPKPASVKRATGIAETARLFFDVDEMIRRSQTQPLTRYVE